MRIKTITCHDVDNYGASLQAYALEKYLMMKGHDVEVIDYLPDYLPCRLDYLRYTRSFGRLNALASTLPFLKPLIALYDHLKSKQGWNNLRFLAKKKRFRRFKRDFLKCTSLTYRSYKQLKENPPIAEAYIAGSDQIWNSMGQNGRDPAYYLSFAPPKSLKMSYAASFGGKYIQHGYSDFVKEHISKFDFISVREKSGVEIVEKLGLKATEVLDPVFLLDGSFWSSLCNDIHKEKYILVYDLNMNHPGVKRLAIELAKKNNWKIYSLNDFRTCSYADKNINDAGPIDFINWIKFSQFVICTSFHGTAFSVLLQKQFYTFPLFGQANSSRMSDFLQKIKLSSHFIEDVIDVREISDVNYHKVQTDIQYYQKLSRNWLDCNLNNIHRNEK